MACLPEILPLKFKVRVIPEMKMKKKKPTPHIPDPESVLREQYFEQTPLYKEVTAMLQGKGLSDRLKKARPLSEMEFSKAMTNHEQDLLQSKPGKEAMELLMVAMQYAHKTAVTEKRELHLRDIAEKFLDLTPKRKKRKPPVCIDELRRYLQTYLEPPDKTFSGKNNLPDCDNCNKLDQCDDPDNCYYDNNGSTQVIKRRDRAKAKRILKNVEKGEFPGKY